ncbi:MAG TPA: beta-galactosidase [Terriglobia bacterium]|nr:beta-galactosidase [Terriglobia bacterium]
MNLPSCAEKNRRRGALLAAVLAAGLPVTVALLRSSFAAQPAASPAGAFFPVAVWYGGGKARAPMMSPLEAQSAAQWGQDLDQIKAAGFNTVKCWVDWASSEPKPGEFDFANLNLLLKLAEQRGLRVIVQIYTDSAPDWVGVRYPDGRFVDRSGAVIASQSAPGYCIDHAGVRAEIVKFLEALSRDANRSPALYGWDVWSEPHVINWADFPYLSNPEFCFCASSQARFRRWLEAKYQTLDALNAAWYRKFASWDEVQPPRFSTILSYTDYLDWRAFIDDKLAGDLKTRVDAIRTADRAHAITSHAAVPGLFTSPTDGFGEPDDWKMSANADFFGTSIYPKHSESTHPWPYWMLAAGLDFTRSAGHSLGKGFWIGELQAGQGSTGMRIAGPVSAHDEEYWMWQAIAHGAREIALYAWYPMSSGFESNGYGLINLDGTLTDRARAAGATARTIESEAASLGAAEPARAQVAILYDRLSYLVGGSQPSLSNLGNAERDSLLGAYRAFFEKQIPVDFVDPAAQNGERLDHYKILFLPYPVMLSQSVAAEVKNYIAGGGTAVAEARLAWNDERGFASPVIPGFGLEQVFGAREERIRPEAEPHLVIEASANLPGLKAGDSVAAAAFEEDLLPLEGGRVLARFAGGEPAIVEKTYGKGRAVLIGSFAGLAYQRNHDPSTRELLWALAQAAGVTPEVKVTGEGTAEVEVRRLASANREFLFVFNHASAAADATISARLPWRVNKARDVVAGQAVAVQVNGDEVALRKNLAADAVWVVSVDRE